ncbi:MAG: acyl-CoA dehydrogenase family protein [Proteobacteria bacterium]|nr:acyl-CoA dehydrogenase family protein [Pseudomonadota bacterium]
MDIALSDDLRAFQGQVRDFLHGSLTPEIREAARLSTTILAAHGATQDWHQIMFRQGWAAPSWPTEHGGPGWDPMRRYLFAVEYARAGAPRLSPLGLGMVGPAIMGHGSAAQQAFYLPRILSGEDVWCQGYSEPGAGSDLASLQCRAVRDGDDYIVNGSKTWTTNAHHANRMFCLVRTDTTGKPQAGISFLLLAMNSPGIRVAPIHILGGDHEFNQVFFDDVRVPQQNRVGAENDGWTVAKYLLEFERGGSAHAAALRASLDEVRRMARGRRDSDGQSLLAEADFARNLSALEIELTTLEFTEHRTMAEIAKRGRPGPASSMLKTRATEVQQAVSELAMGAIAYYAAPHQPEERLPGANLEAIGQRDEMSVTARYLNDRAASIYGGSNEIQRNIMAKLVLGL